jgi:hypothetical protein
VIGFPRRFRYGFLFAAMFLVGCGWLGGDSPLISNETLLKYVPADTAYVFASVEPLPDEIADIYQLQVSSVWSMVQLGMQNAMGEDGTAQDQEGLAILNELTSAETLEATGINRDSTSVFYGFGLLPVFRITLAEGHAIDGVLDRLERLIEQEAGDIVATASIADQEYRFVEADQAHLVVAVLDNELVVTLIPTGYSDSDLRAVLGLDLPDRSIADSGRLETIADEYGFTSNLIAMLDVERLVGTFFEEPSPSDAALFDLVGYEAAEVSAVCRDEFLRVAGVLPLLAGGYTELGSDSIAMRLVARLREDIAAELASIPTPVQGMGAATDALISFGMSFDIPAVRSFVEARFDAIEADPFECEAFSGWQESVASARMVLNQPLTPIVDSVRGFAATIDLGDIDFANMEAMPEDLAVGLLVAADNAGGIIQIASAFVPQIAALDLRTDGQIVELDLPPPYSDPSTNPFGAVFFAATETVFGFGLGETGEARLGELMTAPVGDSATFLSMSIDLSSYYGLMADTAENLAPLDPDAPPLAVMAAMTDVMRNLQALYSKQTVEVMFTERGVEIPVRLELAQ